MSPLLDYQGRARRRARNMLVGICSNVALNFALIPLWGAEGAAVASSAAVCPYVLLNLVEARQVLSSEGPPPDWETLREE